MKIVVMSIEGPDTGVEVIDVAGLVVRYGGRAVLHGVSTKVRRGSLTVLLGPNGSGKSTLVRAAVGLIPLGAGEVRLFGTPLARFRDWHRIGYVPQRTTAATGVPATVREVVTSGRLAARPWWRPMGAADRAGVAGALETVGLGDRAGDSVATLSGGQQQRVLIARALAGRPDLLIMDEPMAGVDFAHQEDFARTMGVLASEGRTVVLVAHELGALEPLVDRTLVLRGGTVVYDGPPPAADSPAGGLVAQDPHGHSHDVLTPHQSPARWW
jgi:zinc transport system ATP-binding protein